MAVAPEILSDIGPLLARLKDLGIQPQHSQYDAQSFGDFAVDLAGSKGTFRIVRDRSQYIIYGNEAQLKLLGAHRAFNTVEELAPAVLGYARTVV